MYRTNGQRSHGPSLDLLGLSPELYVNKKKTKKKNGSSRNYIVFFNVTCKEVGHVKWTQLFDEPMLSFI